MRTGRRLVLSSSRKVYVVTDVKIEPRLVFGGIQRYDKCVSGI